MNRPCPVCTQSTSEPFLGKGDLRLVRCPNCGMVFANPLPAEASDAFYDRLGRPFYLSPDKLAGDYASVRFEREIRLLRRFRRSGSILDVGCSTGAFLHQIGLRHPGAYQTTGIEVSRAALEYAREQGIEVIEDSVLTHAFAGRRFDIITFWAVLEHLPDPAAFLRRARELLNPGGLCLVLVPNLGSMAVRLLGGRYRYILAQHVNYFTASTLAEVLRRGGFQPLARGGCHFNPMVLWQDWRRGTDAAVSDAERTALLARTTRMKQASWLTPARMALGSVERVLGAAGLADNLWAAAVAP